MVLVFRTRVVVEGSWERRKFGGQMLMTVFGRRLLEKVSGVQNPPRPVV
jgi:hypothetical protein